MTDTRRAPQQPVSLTLSLRPQRLPDLDSIQVRPHLSLEQILDADQPGHSDASGVSSLLPGHAVELHPELVGVPFAVQSPVRA